MQRNPETRRRELIVWTVLGLVAAVVLAPLLHAVFPFYPDDWSVDRDDAVEIALERMRDLGPQVENPYVVTRLHQNRSLEYRLQQALGAPDTEPGDLDELAGWVLGWWVTVYQEDARVLEWTYRALVSPSGEVLELSLRVDPDQELDDLDADRAVPRATELLRRAGFDLDRYGEPTTRRRDLGGHTQTEVRFARRVTALGADTPYGLMATFAGDRSTGFELFLDNPRQNEFLDAVAPVNLVGQLAFFSPFFVLPFVAVRFLRRYHNGEVGVRRAVQIFCLVLACGLLSIALAARGSTEGTIMSTSLSRAMTTLLWGAQISILWVSVLALASAVSWTVGEASSRERWGHKLASFDALFQRDPANATVARSGLLGPALGAVLAVLVLLTGWVAMVSTGSRPMVTMQMGPWWQDGALPGLGLLIFLLAYTLYSELVGRLVLLTTLRPRVGPALAVLVVATVSAFLFLPAFGALSVGITAAVSALFGGFLAWVFLRYDLLTTLLASFTAGALLVGWPLLLAADPSLQVQGFLPLVLALLPLALSARHLGSGREFVYRYEDVPAHVRRIAERERQRVELETARGIQSSILPDLPPSLGGVELASRYLPASEVGGDFYDVLALDDGRVALAVGDVAGHGVSSGLVMSMARSALAVQATFDPEVASVFRTLNRTVYQTARRRLLTTLAYALVDPSRGEVEYASAGHLFPYVVDPEGRVTALESVAYPLGVRDSLEVVSRRYKLRPGDSLFLMSDGIVEAHPEGSDEMYGFERLETTLERLAGLPAARICDGVLEDLERFTGKAPRDDDWTVLVARLPDEP